MKPAIIACVFIGLVLIAVAALPSVEAQRKPTLPTVGNAAHDRPTLWYFLQPRVTILLPEEGATLEAGEDIELKAQVVSWLPLSSVKATITTPNNDEWIIDMELDGKRQSLRRTFTATFTDTSLPDDYDIVVEATTSFWRFKGDDESYFSIQDTASPGTWNTLPNEHTQGPILIELLCDDQGSGCDEIWYCVDVQGTCTPDVLYSGEPFAFNDEHKVLRQQAVDVVGNPSTLLNTPILVDNTAPTVASQEDGTQGDEGYWISDVTVTLDCDDGIGSGCGEIWYCTDTTDTCDPTITYANPVIVQGDDAWFVRFASEDTAGNQGTPQSVAITIDTASPTTTDDAPQGWVQSASVSLACDDQGSGCGETWYCVDVQGTCTPDQLYQTGITLDQTGQHHVRYASTDVASNQEVIKEAVVHVDATPPNSGDTVPATWSSGPVEISLGCADQESGCFQILYCVDGTGSCIPDIVYVDSFQVTEEYQFLRFSSEDMAGNQEPIQEQAILIDQTAPITTDNAPQNWAQSAIIELLCNDNGDSGCLNTYYCYDATGTCDPTITYSETDPIQVTESGQILRYFSEDLVGNAGETANVPLGIDTTPPVTTEDLTGTQGQDGWWLSDVTIDLDNCVDTESGCAVTYYCLSVDYNCVPDQVYSTPFVAIEGIWYLRFYSEDNAGNIETIKERSISIDATPPATADDAPQGWVQGPIQVNLFCNDGSTGCESTFYCIDSQGTCTPDQAFVNPIGFSIEGETLRYHSLDYAGNQEPTATVPILIDLTAPTTTIDLDGENGGQGFRTNVQVTLTCDDQESGCDDIYYCLDNENTCDPATVYAAPFMISEDGTWYVRYNSMDNAGNEELEKWDEIMIDTIAPVITPVSPVLDETLTVLATSPTVEIEFRISVGEEIHGATAQYQVDGGAWYPLVQDGGDWISAAGGPLLARGAHQVAYSVEDLAGNPSDPTSVPFTLFLESEAADCGEATTKLNGDYDKVLLTASVTDHSGDCVTVQTDNVILDGQNFVLDGIGAGNGINLNGHSGVTIQNVQVSEFSLGLFSQQNSDNLQIVGSNFVDNGDGILLQLGSNVEISSNTFESNSIGVELVAVSDFDINSNVFISNDVKSLSATLMSDSVITENDITANPTFELIDSNNNIIYHNNFLGNGPPFDDGTNSWDNGTGGNYWSDHTCNDGDQNGICDDPYLIPGGSNQDNFPFVNTNGW